MASEAEEPAESGRVEPEEAAAGGRAERGGGGRGGGGRGGGGPGGGGGAAPVVQLPYMLEECGSQTYEYVLPAWKTTSSQVVSPVPPTVVALFTPGPLRWKLWVDDRSCTRTSYVPGASDVTGFPEESSSSIT